MKISPSVFTTVDEQEIFGRGTAKVVVKPPGVAIPERNDIVILDGVPVVVCLVEYLSHFRSMQELVAQELRLGLFVKAAEAEETMETEEIPVTTKTIEKTEASSFNWYLLLSVDVLTKRVKNAFVSPATTLTPPAGLVYVPLGSGFEHRVEAINALERKELVWLGEVGRTLGGKIYRGEAP